MFSRDLCPFDRVAQGVATVGELRKDVAKCSRVGIQRARVHRRILGSAFYYRGQMEGLLSRVGAQEI